MGYDFGQNQLGQFSSHIGQGHVLVSYPKVMGADDAEDVVGMLKMEIRRIVRMQMQENDWCNAAATG